MRQCKDDVLSSAQDFWSASIQPRVSQIQHIACAKYLAADARRTLDDELRAMHLAMCSLRSCRNTLAPISRLPAEVLARVFQFYADVDPPGSHNDCPGQWMGWVHVMHVCRHWRNTGLTNSALWTNINLTLGLRWAEQAMHLSKVAPLSIDSWSLGPEKCGEVIAKHLSHTRRLDLSLTAEDLEKTMATLTPPAPILESIKFSSSNGLASLPNEVVDKHWNRLRHVLLTDVRMPWTSPIFCDLTHLHIEWPFLSSYSDDAAAVLRGRWDDMALYDNFFGALERMPALEMLFLDRCLPLQLDGHRSGHSISLPHLKTLSLRDTSFRCGGIIKHLLIPPSCRLKFEFEWTSAAFSESPDVLNFLAVHIHGSTPLQLLSISIPEDSHNRLCYINAWRRRPVDDKPPLVEKADLSFSFRSPWGRIDPLDDLCRGMPLNQLRVLHVACDHCPPVWTSLAWVDMFKQCQALEHVYIAGGSTEVFCQAFGMPMDDPDAFERETWTTHQICAEQVFLPSLKLLELERVRFDLGTEWHGGGRFNFELHDMLPKWLARRKNVKGIPTISIKNSRIQQNWI
ncbi:hypothetical protein EWM64_g3078, partial [Hericium alpestre]